MICDAEDITKIVQACLKEILKSKVSEIQIREITRKVVEEMDRDGFFDHDEVLEPKEKLTEVE